MLQEGQRVTHETSGIIQVLRSLLARPTGNFLFISRVFIIVLVLLNHVPVDHEQILICYCNFREIESNFHEKYGVSQHLIIGGYEPQSDSKIDNIIVVY